MRWLGDLQKCQDVSVCFIQMELVGGFKNKTRSGMLGMLGQKSIHQKTELFLHFGCSSFLGS